MEPARRGGQSSTELTKLTDGKPGVGDGRVVADHGRDGAPADRSLPVLRADCGELLRLVLCGAVVPGLGRLRDRQGRRPALPESAADFGCGIHGRLREDGFKGCTVYDCFGAGQRVPSRRTTGGAGARRRRPPDRCSRCSASCVNLHELLWYLTLAQPMVPAGPLRGTLRSAVEETEALARRDAVGLAALLEGTVVAAHRDRISALLSTVSDLARTDARRGRRKPRDPPGRPTQGRISWGRRSVARI